MNKNKVKFDFTVHAPDNSSGKRVQKVDIVWELYRHGGLSERAARQNSKGKDGIALFWGLYRLN